MKQMRPSSYPKGFQLMNKKNLKLTQTWHKYGLCPERTIPIRRSTKNLTLSSKHRHPSSSNGVTNTNEEVITFKEHKRRLTFGNHLTEKPEEYSTSQLWISNDNVQEVIEAGLQVNKILNGHDQPSIFVYWTADGYNTTGCFNIQCSGFVQTTSEISFGSEFDHISVFNGDQYSATYKIFRDHSTANWWLLFENTCIGYWPNFLFKQLYVKAAKMAFGGEVLNTQPNGRHTNTQMGSGHFPAEGGFGISSFFHSVKVLDGNREWITPDRVSVIIKTPGCYGLKLDQKDSSGIKFNYGGPGFSDTCQ
ncbi:hypothetical protein MKW92_048011 [Papaver armeniacum]|nr:hypothetical protein MKW92_048011 [Papaver armeniacum]